MLLCRRWVLEAVEVIPHPSAKRSNTTVGFPCRYPLDALTCRKYAGHGRHLCISVASVRFESLFCLRPPASVPEYPCLGCQQSGSDPHGCLSVGGVRGSG